MTRTILTAAFSALVLSTAEADVCMDKATTQAAMNACAQQAYQARDAELNALFREIRRRLEGDSDARGLLQGSERAWLAFRDAECAFATSKSGEGSARSLAYDMCLADLTQKRVEELRQYLQCGEGDLSCPVPAN